MSRMMAAAQEVILLRSETEEAVTGPSDHDDSPKSSAGSVDEAVDDGSAEAGPGAEVSPSKPTGKPTPRARSSSGSSISTTAAAGVEAEAGWAWSGKNNIMVCVRVRPMNRTERRSSNEVVRVLDDKVVVIMDPKTQDTTRSFLDPLRAARTREKRYAFDHVFNPSAPQRLVFNRTTRLLVPGVIEGYNATVFAYGATGAGKTFTMLGTPTNPGCMFNTLQFLFDEIDEMVRKQSVVYTVKISMIEIYNELIKDLLEPSSDNLDLREDPIKGPTVAGMAEIEAKSAEEVMGLLQDGNKNRTQEATEANATSSRSHAVLQVVVEQRDRNPGPQSAVKIGKLSMIDLAGSERASSTNNRGQRLIEGANINRSLLALGNCINALVMSKTNGFIPYRDSKLTRLLKDSLGGNCRTIMIANITPAASSFEETLNTLKYANRAKKIKTQATRNVLNVSYHVTQYLSLIAGLKKEIKGLKSELDEARTAASPTHGDGNNDDVLSASINNRESKELKEVRAEIVKGFNESMQLQKALVEIDSQAVQQKIEMRKLQLVVVRGTDQNVLARAAHQSTHRSVKSKRRIEGGTDVADTDAADRASDSDLYSDDDDFDNAVQEAGYRQAHEGSHASGRDSYANVASPKAVERAREQLARLESQYADTQEQHRRVAEKIAQIQDNNRALKREVMGRLHSSDRVELLELEIRHGTLEVQNMELEHSRMKHQSIIEEKDTLIQRLRLQLEARDSVIRQQRAALEALGASDRCQTAYQTLERLPTATKRSKSSVLPAPAHLHSKHQLERPHPLQQVQVGRYENHRGHRHADRNPHHDDSIHGGGKRHLKQISSPGRQAGHTTSATTGHLRENDAHHRDPSVDKHGRHHHHSDRQNHGAHGPPSRQRSGVARGEDSKLTRAEAAQGSGGGGLYGFVRSDEFPGLHVQADLSGGLDQTVVRSTNSPPRAIQTKATHSPSTGRGSPVPKMPSNFNVVRLSPLNVNLPSRLRSPRGSPHEGAGMNRFSERRSGSKSPIARSPVGNRMRNHDRFVAQSSERGRQWDAARDFHDGASGAGSSPIPMRIVSSGVSPHLLQPSSHRVRDDISRHRKHASDHGIYPEQQHHRHREHQSVSPRRGSPVHHTRQGAHHVQHDSNGSERRSKKNGGTSKRRGSYARQKISFQEKIQRSTDRFKRQQRLRQQQSEAVLRAKVAAPRTLPSLAMGVDGSNRYESQAAREYREKHARNKKARSSSKKKISGYKKRHAGTMAVYQRNVRR